LVLSPRQQTPETGAKTDAMTPTDCARIFAGQSRSSMNVSSVRKVRSEQKMSASIAADKASELVTSEFEIARA
jgi:hypothetical protein